MVLSRIGFSLIRGIRFAKRILQNIFQKCVISLRIQKKRGVGVDLIVPLVSPKLKKEKLNRNAWIRRAKRRPLRRRPATPEGALV
jgi:ribosomal protein L19